MANNFTEKKYLDFEGLSHFWTKVKEKFEAADSALKSELQGEFAAADSALKTELTTEIDKKVAKSDYKAKMGQLDSAINGINNTLDTLTGADDFNGLVDRVETLEGDDKGRGKSVREIANEELAAQLIPGNADKSLDELKEIAAWIQSHPGDAAAMNKAIQANATAIATETTNRSNADIDLGNRIQALEDAKYGDAISNAINGEAAEREAQDNKIKAAVGLAAEGDNIFLPNTSANYIKSADNVRGEISLLDSKLKEVADNVAAIDYVTPSDMNQAFSDYDAKFVKITTAEIDSIFA